MKLSVRKGENSLENGETRDDCVKKPNKDDCHWTFLMLSMGLFLCTTTSLIMITEISSVALTYQNRNLLIAIYDEQLNISETSISLLPTTTTSTPENSTSTFSTPVKISTAGTTEAVTETTSEKLLSSTPSETSVRDPSSSTSKSLPECFNEGNPVCILEYFHNPPKEYKCIQSCNYPPIVTARLNISLSALKDNFAVLTVQVATNKDKVAKRKIAYMGLGYLYKDDVEKSKVESEWWEDIPDCKVIGINATWRRCE